MKDDRVRLGDARAWLLMAARDIRAAEHGLTASPPLLEDVLFHCQQVVEKAFKGFLTWHDIPFRRTPSLEEIGRLCAKTDPALKGQVDQAVPLSEYAWKFRYPGEIEEPSKEEAEEALKTSREVFEAVLACLPKEVLPTNSTN